MFPIKITDRAIDKMMAAKESDTDLGQDAFVRISCKGGGCSGFLFELNFDNEPDESDIVSIFYVEDKTLKVAIDDISAEYVKGVTVDYVKQGFSEGFKFIGGDNVKRTCGCGNSFSID